MNGWTIDVDDPRVDDVQALLERHLQFASQHSPPEHVHALDVSGLLGPEITFVSLETGSMAAFAAARRLYARLGFVDCAAIEGYLPSDYSCFMTRSLI